MPIRGGGIRMTGRWPSSAVISKTSTPGVCPAAIVVVQFPPAPAGVPIVDTASPAADQLREQLGGQRVLQ